MISPSLSLMSLSFVPSSSLLSSSFLSQNILLHRRHYHYHLCKTTNPSFHLKNHIMIKNSTSLDFHIQPLRDIRVLFTAPYVYAPRLGHALLSRHARPIHMPSIETLPLSMTTIADSIQLETAVLTLCDFDIIAFPSRTSIIEFSRILTSHLQHTSSSSSLSSSISTIIKASGVRIAALGADALAVREFLHVEPHYIPPSATPLDMVDMIANDDSIQACDTKILVPIPVVDTTRMSEPPVIPQFLHAFNNRIKRCTVNAVPAYVTTTTRIERLDVELNLLNNGQIDAIVICSIGEAYAFISLLKQKQMYHQFVRNVQQGNIIIAAHGPVTAKGMQQAFLDLTTVDINTNENDSNINSSNNEEDQNCITNLIVVSKDWSSFDGVVRALEDAFANRIKHEGKLLIPES